MAEKYKWRFSTIGGGTRVVVSSGNDIAHLDELDQKLWTVLSCPTAGLDIDRRTLDFLDTDKDGKIRVNEVVAAAKWLTGVLNDPDILLGGVDSIPVSCIDSNNEEGARLLSSARQILANLGKDGQEEISVADSSDTVAIFAKTRFNGDGIITVESSDDETLRGIIQNVIDTIGSCVDRSGAAGIDADQVEAFYAACADYAAWQAGCKADEAAVLPYGEDTDAALTAFEALKDKVADHFMRCKLAAFDSDTAAVLDVPVASIEAISSTNLAASAEIETYPIARVNSECLLPLDGGINPAWDSRFKLFKSLVLDKEFPEKKTITEAEWNAAAEKLSAYASWKAAKKGGAVESLGIDAVNEILKGNRKADILDLIAKDKALEAESASIDAVDKLTHYVRDFYKLLKNYVTFSDFYNSYKGDVKAVFQCGNLYIDQRCLDLCVNIADMGKQVDVAALSGMYLLYCTCVSKAAGKSMNIVAVLTDGDVDNLRIGMNAVFYDNDGLDYDATVTKIVDNPISIRQAFWTPYRKCARMIEEQIAKSAAKKDAKVMEDMNSTVTTAEIPKDKDEAALLKTKKDAFDIAKFAGVFAAIGLALGAIGSVLTAVITGFLKLEVWQMVIVVVAILLVISGPSMFLAWLKLRKRNLAPVLNSNGWAINSNVLVNTRFGATLTHLADVPVVKTKDPFAEKKHVLRKIVIWLLVILAVIVYAVYKTGKTAYVIDMIKNLIAL